MKNDFRAFMSKDMHQVIQQQLAKLGIEEDLGMGCIFGEGSLDDFFKGAIDLTYLKQPFQNKGANKIEELLDVVERVNFNKNPKTYIKKLIPSEVLVDYDLGKITLLYKNPKWKKNLLNQTKGIPKYKSTSVQTTDNDEFDLEKGILIALLQKYLGLTKTEYSELMKNIFEKIGASALHPEGK